MTYESSAPTYNALRRHEQYEKIRAIQPFLADAETVLDVGFGTGLASDVLTHEITGVEPSKAMLKEYQGDAETVHDSAENLLEHFEEDVFDAAICVSTAHHFTDPVSVFDDIRAVTKPRGVVAATFLKRDSSTPHCIEAFKETFNDVKTEETRHDAVYIGRVPTDNV
jgi:SAM-dependent methyltransferase